MAKLTKRQPSRQMTKDSSNRASESESSSGEEDRTKASEIPISQRTFARPVGRTSHSRALVSENVNPFKDLKLPFATATTPSMSNSSSQQEQTRPDKISEEEREALVNLKGLNTTFQKTVAQSLEKDAHIDLSSLFTQYLKYRGELEAKFDAAEKHRKSQQLTLGFEFRKLPSTLPPFAPSQTLIAETPNTAQKETEAREPSAFNAPEIRPVSVELPQFAIKPAPPTPVIYEDKIANSSRDPKNRSFNATPDYVFPKSPDSTVSAVGAPATKTTDAKKESEPMLGRDDAGSNGENKEPSAVSDKSRLPFVFNSPFASLPAFGTSTNQPSSGPLFNFASSQTKDPSQDKTEFKFSFPSQSSQQQHTQPPFSFTPPSQSSQPLPFSFGGHASNRHENHHAADSSQPSQFSQLTVGEKDNDEEAEGIPEGEEDSFLNTRTNDDLVKRGAGEEAEEELFPPTRSKLFVYDTSVSSWTDLGIALVKVNHRPADGSSARILCRAEGTGRILLNASLDSKVFSSSHADGKREVILTCFNQDSRLAKYLIRTKEAEQATSLQQILISNLH